LLHIRRAAPAAAEDVAQPAAALLQEQHQQSLDYGRQGASERSATGTAALLVIAAPAAAEDVAEHTADDLIE
jgi:hypothetical protein